MKQEPKPLLLVFPFGLLSHYLRCIVVARHLSPFFRIRFAHHEKYSHFVKQEGFATFPFPPTDETAVMSRIARFDFSWLNEHDMEEWFLNQWKR